MRPVTPWTLALDASRTISLPQPARAAVSNAFQAACVAAWAVEKLRTNIVARIKRMTNSLPDAAAQWQKTDHGMQMMTQLCGRPARMAKNSAILDLLTRYHGRHAELGARRRITADQAVAAAGNSVHVQWRAGWRNIWAVSACELARALAGELMDGRDALAGLNAFTAMTIAAMPERDAHAACSSGAVRSCWKR